MRPYFLLTLLVSSLGSAAVAQGSGLTDDEMLERFIGQSEAVQNLGTTRSIGLVSPSSDGTPPDDGVVEAELTSLEDLGDDASPAATAPLRFGEELEIDIAIKFEFDSAVLSASATPELNQMCRVIKRAESIEQFKVIGHTDSAGSDEYNQRLSQLRAEEVGRYFVNNCDIPATRLLLVGYGEAFPKNPTDTRAPENRRVEFQVVAPLS